MIRKLFVLSVIAFLCCMAWLIWLNQGQVQISVTQELVYEVPKTALILLAVALGSLFVLYIYTGRDFDRYVQSKREAKKRKTIEDAEKHFEKGQKYLIGKRFSDAIEEFNIAMRGDPAKVAYIMRLGDAFTEKRDHENAATYYNQVLTLDNANVEAMFKMAMLKKSMGKQKEALSYIDKFLELDPLNPACIEQKQLLLEGLYDWEELINVKKELIKSLSDNEAKQREQKELVGYEYEQARKSFMGEDYDTAKKALKTIIKDNPKFVPAHLTVADIMVIEGAKNEAAEYLEKTHELTGSIIPLVKLENLLINMGLPSNLIKVYRDAIERAPDDEVLKFFLGKLYLRLEMLDDAIEIFAAFDNTAICYPEIEKLQANIYFKRGEFEKAANEFIKKQDSKESISYTCTNCGHKIQKWQGRCPDCRKWNTFSFTLDKINTT